MKEKLTGYWEKVKSFFGKINKKTRILLSVVLAAIVLGAVVIALVLNNRPYVTLFTGLSSGDMSSIVTYLEENGVADYRVQNNDTILVRSNQEAQLKAQLLIAGYPGQSGFGYDTYFDNVGAMTTESQRNFAVLADLQDRMAAVIRCLDGVRDASVTISQGEDRRYVLDSDNVIKSSAAVMVIMQDGAKLTNEQADAIRRLVSRAVKGLEIENVEISDSFGNTYSAGDTITDIGDASQLKLQLEEQVDNKVRTEIMKVLLPLYGEDNVRVAVNSTVDVSRTIGESTVYNTPDGAPDGEGIIGTRVWEQEIIRGTEDGSGGNVGTATNSEFNDYVEQQAQPEDGDTYIHNGGEENHNVNSNVEQTERLAGTVTDLNVAVSINATTAGNVDVDSLTSHIARAAGISTDVQGEKISILVDAFYQAPEVAPIVPGGLALPGWALYAAAGGLVLFILLLIVIAIVRKKRKRRKEEEASALALAAAGLNMPFAQGEPVPATEGADIMTLRTEKSMELRKDIRQFAESNPEIAAQMVKSWLRGGDDSNG